MNNHVEHFLENFFGKTITRVYTRIFFVFFSGMFFLEPFLEYFGIFYKCFSGFSDFFFRSFLSKVSNENSGSMPQSS